MIDGLKPYPAMRDPGVEWLGQVPVHWEVRRTKTVLAERSEKGFPAEPLLAATQTKGVIRKEKYDNRTVLALKDLHLLKLVHVADFVISLRSFQGGIEYARNRGIISPAYTILYSIQKNHRAYLAHLFKSMPYLENLSLFVTGIRQGQNIDYNKLSRSYLPLPPIFDQTAIVRLLDYVDRRIQHYIRTKEKLIALLKEYRQAIIHQAVTGKINVRTSQPYPAYKDSGVEWLGEVPEHWEVAQLRRFAVDRCDGPFGSGLKSSHYTEDGIRVVRLQNIGNGEFRDSDVAFISPDHYSTLGDHSVILGDILVAGLGDNNHPAGRVCVVPENIGPAMVKADCFRFRPDKDQVDPHFVALQLTATASTASALLSTGATRQRTNLQSTSARAISIPAFHEQALVVEYTENATFGTRAAQETARRGIACLREYRARLIADVVTGKLDVRGAAAGLPKVDPLAGDDVDDPEDHEVDSALEDLESRTEVII